MKASAPDSHPVSQSESTLERAAGSFRDPDGYVFGYQGRIFRAIGDSICQQLRELQESGTLAALVADGLLVRTEFVTEPGLIATFRAADPRSQYYLEHERIDAITYPYEWSVSMLAEAARLTLDLQMRLAEHGFALKDATAYNVQFVQGRPVFIDAGSVERPQRPDVWYALGQFERMFVLPLLLCRYRGWDLRSYFLGNLDGRTPAQVIRSFGRFARWSPGLLFDLTLPHLLDRRAEKSGSNLVADLAKPGKDNRGLLLNLQRLRRKVLKLAAGYQPRGVWAGYTQTCTYDQTAEECKKSRISDFLRRFPAASVLDLGCNTGDYSFLAVKNGARVVACDADHDAVELLFRRLRGEPKPITPLVLDLANPSPAIGCLNRERSSFLERADADCVFALALMHHLLVSANFSIEVMRDVFFALTRRDLVLEFVPPGDAMFRRLVRFRQNLHGGLNLENFLAVFSKMFELIEQHPIANTARMLLFFRKRT